MVLLACNSSTKPGMVEATFEVNRTLLSSEAYLDEQGLQLFPPKTWIKADTSTNPPLLILGEGDYFFNPSDSSMLLISPEPLDINFEGHKQRTAFIVNDVLVQQTVFQDPILLIFQLVLTDHQGKSLFYVVTNNNLEDKLKQIESSIGSISFQNTY